MLSIIRTASGWLNKIFGSAAMIFLALLLAASSIQVLSRYFLNISQSWTEEFARYCFIWSSLLGATVLTKSKGHAVVDIAVKRLRGWVQKVHRALLCLIIIAIGVVLIVHGGELMGITAAQKSPSLGIPLSVVYLAIPVCGAGICIHVLCELIEVFLGPQQSSETTAEEAN